jgi:Ankyrin repeats (many copies)
MPTVPLPDRPSLEQLRKQAKDLRASVVAGDPGALAEVAEHYSPAPDTVGAGSSRLAAAQLVLARRYGFRNWPALRRYVETVERYSRFPARMANAGPTEDTSPAGSSEPAGHPALAGNADAADAFLRLACLTYDEVGPQQWAQARGLLAAHPRLTAGNVYAAAVAGDVAELARILANDPAAASREGGPYRWEPLYYLAYARHDPAIAQAAVLGCARLLLAAGASPDVGYLWHGLPSPFTALTGVFGEGELGPERQPRHPHSLALGRLLLEAGADPNDAQALYNRMFEPDNDHLELLLEFGLGSDRGGPWLRLLGDELGSPDGMITHELAWAITHGLAERVELLVSNGADVSSPLKDDVTAADMAATTGHPELIGYLVGHGAPPPALEPAEALVAAALAADGAEVARLQQQYPGLVAECRAARPGLVAWAATTGRAAVIELLADLGFDLNARGRTDVPSNQPWQTALHLAAQEGYLELAQTLLRLGADPDITDQRFDGTPLGWARYFGQPELIALLEPVTGRGAPDSTGRPD